MPHVIVKMYPGRSGHQKTQLAEAIVKDVMAVAKVGDEAVSVAIEEVTPSDWAEKVYTTNSNLRSLVCRTYSSELARSISTPGSKGLSFVQGRMVRRWRRLRRLQP